MNKVYESSTALEAYMVKNLLESEGLESRVDGEYLQGGIGELQAVGIVRVMVVDSDYTKAMQVIQEWESKQEATDQEEPKSNSSSLIGFIVGVVLTAGLAYSLFMSPVLTDGIDYNGDGFMDEKWVYSRLRILESNLDRNFDRTYDFVYYYDRKGLPKSARSDDDFDGKFETTIIFRDGQVLREDSDTDQNGINDYRVNYKYGVLDSIEFIDEDTGKIRKRQIYKQGKLVFADYDSNSDGIMDQHHEYDRFEEIK